MVMTAPSPHYDTSCKSIALDLFLFFLILAIHCFKQKIFRTTFRHGSLDSKLNSLISLLTRTNRMCCKNFTKNQMRIRIWILGVSSLYSMFSFTWLVYLNKCHISKLTVWQSARRWFKNQNIFHFVYVRPEDGHGQSMQLPIEPRFNNQSKRV